MRLFLTRHGETEENIKDIVTGHMPGTLTDNGKLQAKKLAARLKDEKIDVIYSSDLKRAEDTAKEIAIYHLSAKFIVTQDLREADAGSFTGKTGKEVDWKNPPKDVESRQQRLERAKKLIDMIYRKHKNDNVLLVGHNGINKAIIAVILGKKPEQFSEIEKPGNTSLYIFDIEEDSNHKVHLMNCMKHLS